METTTSLKTFDEYKKPEFLPTFIENLPDGIFIRGRRYMVSGRPGTGKSSFAYTFLNAGLQQDEGAVYVTNDQTLDNVLTDASSLEIDLVTPIQQGRLAVIEASKYMGTMEIDESTNSYKQTDINDMMERVQKEFEKVKARRFVLDPIAPIITPQYISPKAEGGVKVLSQSFGRRLYDTSDPNLTWIRQFLGVLMEYTSKSGVTSVFTSEATIRSPESRYGFEEYMVDGEVILYFEESNYRFRRIMKIPKMRASRVPPAFYESEIGKGGIKVIKNLSEASI